MPRRLPVLLCSLAFMATDAVRMGLPFRKFVLARDLDDAAELFINLLGEINNGKHPARIEHNAVSLISTILSHSHEQDPVDAPAAAPTAAPTAAPVPPPAEATCSETDALCNFLDRMVNDPVAIFQMILSVYNAYTGAMNAQAAEKWTEMFESLRLHLWSVFDYATSAAYQTTDEYTNAKLAWDTNFAAMTAAAPAAQADFEAGNATAWADIGNMAITTISETLVAGSPSLTETTTLITDILQGAVTGWSQWANGNRATGVLAAWEAINSTLWQAELWEESSEVGQVLLLVDVVVKVISSSFATFEARVQDPNFCLKDFTTRNSEPVSRCYHGFSFDAELVACVPTAAMGADCSIHCEVGTECTTFCPVDRSYCCMKDDPANPAECQVANYLDLDFTTGNSTVYHQCVSPAISVTVGGALLQMKQKKVSMTAAEMARRPKYKSQSLMEHRSRVKVKSHGTQSLDSAFWSKSASSQQTQVRNGVANTWGAHEPVCDPNSVFFETIEGFPGLCFEECPAGYERVVGGTVEAPTSTDTCKQICQAPFAEDTEFGYQTVAFEVCGQTQAIVSSANTLALDVIKDGISAAISAVQAISAQTELTPAVLEGYMTAIGNLVVHFSRPVCVFPSR